MKEEERIKFIEAIMQMKHCPMQVGTMGCTCDKCIKAGSLLIDKIWSEDSKDLQELIKTI